MDGHDSGHPQVARKCLILMAGWTRLELATSGVTGRRSNQLNYHPVAKTVVVDSVVVGGVGFEPATPCV